MNPFDADMPSGPGDAPRSASQPSGHEIETRLRGRGVPAPQARFRAGVLAAMERAADDRRLMLAAHDRVAAEVQPRRRLLPEMVAAITAAIVVSVVPWGGGSRAVVPPAVTAAVPPEVTPRPADEPADVHRALALLDARRDLFAVVAAASLQDAEF